MRPAERRALLVRSRRGSTHVVGPLARFSSWEQIGDKWLAGARWPRTTGPSPPPSAYLTTHGVDRLKDLLDDWVAHRPTGLREPYLFIERGRRITTARVDRALANVAARFRGPRSAQSQRASRR